MVLCWLSACQVTNTCGTAWGLHLMMLQVEESMVSKWVSHHHFSFYLMIYDNIYIWPCSSTGTIMSHLLAISCNIYGLHHNIIMIFGPPRNPMVCWIPVEFLFPWKHGHNQKIHIVCWCWLYIYNITILDFLIGNYYIGSLNIDIGHNQKIILFINNYLSIPINVPNIAVSHDWHDDFELDQLNSISQLYPHETPIELLVI